MLTLIILIVALNYYLEGDLHFSFQMTVLAIILFTLALAIVIAHLLLNWSYHGAAFWILGLLLVIMSFFPSEDFPILNHAMVLIVGCVFMIVGFLGRYYGRTSESDTRRGKLPSDDRFEEIEILSGTWSPPDWLAEGLTATYDSETSRTYLQVVRKQGRLFMKTRSKSAELPPGVRNSSWEEIPLAYWLEEYYGEPFIDASRDPASQVLFGDETDYLGTEKVSFKGVEYSCHKFKTSKVIDCHCVEIAKHKSFYLGPGSCPLCGGLFPSLRKCSECGGTGKCSSCKGKGKLDTVGYYWYEEKRGLLLRHEFYWGKRKVNVQELKSLTPALESLDVTGSKPKHLL